ncbi:MAG: type 4a pilus biogenesis protein PilO [Pyrinomonadaceae bacterium]
MKIGNLQEMPWYLRLMMFVVVAGVMYAGFWYFITRPTRAQTKELNDEIAQLRPKNAQAQMASQRLNEFRAIYKAREEEYEELKALLPEQRELTMVLQGIQDRARTNGLILRKFVPKDDLQQENYSGKRIEVGVTSSFASLRAFFEQLAHYQRIVSITNFQLNQLEKMSGSRTMEATFDLTAYYVSTEKLQKPAAPQPAGSGQVPATTVPQGVK